MQQGRYEEAQRWIDSLYRQARLAKSADAREGAMSGTSELVASWNASTNRWSERTGRVRVDTTGTDVSTVHFGIALGALC
jgi:hypothetical protein